MINWWRVLFLSSLLPVMAGAQTESNFISRAKVKAASIEEQMSEVNPFLADCLAMIKPTNAYVEWVESYVTKRKNSYFIRISGKTEPHVKVGFATDFITYRDTAGTERNYNFQLRKVPVNLAADGSFSISVVLREGQLFIPLSLETTYRQSYELSMTIGAGGKVEKPMLRPILNNETRSKMCLRSRLDAGFGFNLLMFDQKVDLFGGTLSSSSLETGAIRVRAHLFGSPDHSHEVQLTSLPATLKSAQQFQSDLSLPWLSGSYHFQQRQNKWAGNWRSALFQPFLHYGAQYHSVPRLEVSKADQADVTPIDMLNASVGGGFSLIGENSWLIELSGHLQYPLHSNTPVQYQMIVDGGIDFYGALGSTYYYGIYWGGQLQNFSFSGGEVNHMSSAVILSLGRFF